MRYVFFIIVTIINLILTGTVFPNINIAGIYPDVIMCSIVSIALLERSMAGAMVGLASGLILDLFFSGVIGLYALPYFVIGAGMYFAASSFKYIDRLLLPVGFAVGGYFLKELIMSALAYMLGVKFTFSNMFIRIMLPQALATGLFMILVHLVFSRIYRSSSMKIKSDSEFRHL